MSYYDNETEYKSRGIDSDLCYCLEYNPQGAFNVDDIEKVLAVWEGENDGDDWRWILQLKDGRYVFLQGGCDYTGWDCQSWAEHQIENSVTEAVVCSVEDEDQEVYQSLSRQIAEGKKQTWKEQKDDEFGNSPTAYLR